MFTNRFKHTAVIFCALFIMMASACTEKKLDAKTLDGKWAITQVNEKAIKEQMRKPEISFNITEKKANGSAGCNVFNASIELDAQNIEVIKFQRPATTMMMCPDMEAETMILAAIEKVNTVSSSEKEGEVFLTDTEGKKLLTLTRLTK